MPDRQASLRRNVNMLGSLLGNTIKDHQGEAFFNKIENIRKLAKAARAGNDENRDALLGQLKGLSDDELVPVTRAFSHFLNLANLAEQFHGVTKECEEAFEVPDHFDELMVRLKDKGLTNEQIASSIAKLNMELVLTAHPTEVSRRTNIQKQESIFECLTELENTSLGKRDKDRLENRLQQLIAQTWHTGEFRTQRPTPIDEAKAGYATIEHSLWEAIPAFVRSMDERLVEHTGIHLPLDAVPVRFSSWMGGDRDGNPFVTSKVTEEVLLLSRWVAADLYLRDLKPLIGELSMTECNDEMQKKMGDCREPYRAVLKKLRERLRHTRSWCERSLVDMLMLPTS